MITISKLKFTYNKRKRLFDNLNLNLEGGHIYGLLGKNGTGKSTLLHLMSGLLFPVEGEINAMGSIPGKRQVSFLEELFLVPEEFNMPDVSPVKYAGLYASFYPKFDESQYNAYLKEFEIDLNHSLMKMSMGQRKKAFIAFALACNTCLLLMDEPTNGLDIPSKVQFRRLISSIATEERCIVISTHQVRDLENLIDSVVILENNRIIFNQTIDEVSEKLNFINYNDSEKPAGILYDEPGTLGGKAVTLNQRGTALRIDMELLFNAVVSSKGDVAKLFTDNKN